MSKYRKRQTWEHPIVSTDCDDFRSALNALKQASPGTEYKACLEALNKISRKIMFVLGQPEYAHRSQLRTVLNLFQEAVDNFRTEENDEHVKAWHASIQRRLDDIVGALEKANTQAAKQRRDRRHER